MRIAKVVFLSVLFLSTLFLGGCMEKDIVNHSFEFNARYDSPEIEVLDYWYGVYRATAVRPADWSKKDSPQGADNITGPLHRGYYLYVKWRIKATGEVLKDTVDLRDRLPRNIEKHRIYFVVREKQLYIYLISPEPNPDPFKKPPLSMYSDLKVDEIYPTQPKF